MKNKKNSTGSAVLQLQQLEEESYTSNKVKQTLQTLAEKGNAEKFYNMPTSSSTDLMMKALIAGGNLSRLPGEAKKTSSTAQIDVRSRGDARQVIYTGKGTETIIEIVDINKLLGTNKAAKKIFPYLLIKINEQCIVSNTGELCKDESFFPLQELVDLGFYRSIRAARRGFQDAMEIITSIKVKAVVRQGKKTNATVNEGEGILVLFTGAFIKNNQCSVFLNPRINWKPLFQYFTIMPKYAFRLNNKAFDLMYAIVYLARQNTKSIAQKGYFTISFRVLQARLGLPSEEGNQDPFRTIREPLEKAIKAIEQESAKEGCSMIRLVPVYDVSAGIRGFLNQGYLQIFLPDDLSVPFINQSRRRQGRIEQRNQGRSEQQKPLNKNQQKKAAQ